MKKSELKQLIREVVEEVIKPSKDAHFAAAMKIDHENTGRNQALNKMKKMLGKNFIEAKAQAAISVARLRQNDQFFAGVAETINSDEKDNHEEEDETELTPQERQEFERARDEWKRKRKSSSIGSGYDKNDPKHPDWFEKSADRYDMGR